MAANDSSAGEKVTITCYDRDRHGEETGILWFQGLFEMTDPLYRNTMLHCAVLYFVAASWALHLSWLWSSKQHERQKQFFTLLWTWLIPILFGCANLSWFLLMRSLKHLALSNREIRIDELLSKNPTPEWKAHWVALLDDGEEEGVRKESNQKKKKKKTVIGCVTISLQKDGIINNVNDGNNHDHAQGVSGVWWLAHLTVDPVHRAQGLGNRLAKLAEETARAKGAKRIRILVGNIHSQKFWHSRDYKVVGVSWKLLGHQSIFMERALQ